MKKLISLLLIPVLCFALLPSVAFAANQPSQWATEQVTLASSLGLVPDSLKSDYTRSTTRAEFCALAVKLYEIVVGNEIAGRRTFADSADVNVQKMGSLGVVNGVGNNMFAPNDTITREQAAVMLANLAGATGNSIYFYDTTFADKTQISSWAITQVGQIQSAGIMSGVGNNIFSPKGSYTREQSIVTMLRLYNYIVSKFDPSKHSYAFYNIGSTWADAKAYCESLGGHLATITSKEENDYVYNLLTQSEYDSAYFGLSDSEQEGVWKWVTGEPFTYNNWHTGEPNSHYSAEDYAMFYWQFPDGTWNDGDFGGRTDRGGTVFICEWDL